MPFGFKFDFMEKLCIECIEPANDMMRMWTTALKLRNEFVARGLSTRSSFVETMQEHDSKWRDYHKIGVLNAWWLLRVKDDIINAEIADALNSLDYE